MDDDSAADDPLHDRDFSRLLGYWHGFTFIVFDEENPEAWIRSTYWVPVATEDAEDVAGQSD